MDAATSGDGHGGGIECMQRRSGQRMPTDQEDRGLVT
jgi:hypothetical protein